MNTKSKGEQTEAIVLAELLKAGYVVLLPFGDNQRYDLVVEHEGKFIRVQCKTARMARQESALEFATCSSYAHRGGGHKDYRGAADVFAAYLPDTGQVYIVPVDEAGSRSMTLRLAPAKNNQTYRVRLAQDYLLGEWTP